MNENYTNIYLSDSVKSVQQDIIRPMYSKLFKRLLDDVKTGNKSSYVFRHHINYINKARAYYNSEDYAQQNTPAQIVIDYIASMTDDYFSDLYEYLFPGDIKPEYKSYFA